MYEFTTEGTCSKKIRFDLKDGAVRNISFEKGCEGNLKAIAVLAEGMAADELVKKLKGIKCGGSKTGETSCGDQLARAIEQFK